MDSQVKGQNAGAEPPISRSVNICPSAMDPFVYAHLMIQILIYNNYLILFVQQIEKGFGVDKLRTKSGIELRIKSLVSRQLSVWMLGVLKNKKFSNEMLQL